MLSVSNTYCKSQYNVACNRDSNTDQCKKDHFFSLLGLLSVTSTKSKLQPTNNYKYNG